MGCFFKTATTQIYANSNHNKNNETIDSNTNNQNLTPSTTTAKYYKRITFGNKDIHKDYNQEIDVLTCPREGGKVLCVEPVERKPKKPSGEAVTARNKQKLKERVKHRQQKQTHEEVTRTKRTAETENEGEGEGERDNINDTEYIHRISLSDYSFSHLERHRTSTLKHTYNNRNINKYFHSNGSYWGQTLYSQQQRSPNNDTTTHTQATTPTMRNRAAALASMGTRGQTLSQILLLARDHLACLGNVSACVMENFTGCAATASRTRGPSRKMKKEHHQQQRHQQTRKLPREQQQGANYVQRQEKTTDAETNHCITDINEHCDQNCNTDRHKKSHNNNCFNTLRSWVNFYAASSVILVFCCLTSAAAAASNINSASIDKHPIHGIDWSKFDESSSDKEILDLLLEKKRYDKRLLPPVNDEDFCCGLSSPDMAKDKSSTRSHNRGTLTVNVNVLLLSLASPDESSLKYEVEFLLNQQWNDPRLQYGNKSEYEYLNALHHHDNIWTPDTYFIMHGDFKDPIIPMHFALRIYRNGTITYAMRRHLILSCQGSLHIFPFDDPKCSFSMESISYEEPQIKYVWKNDEDTLRKSPSLTTLNAYLIKNQTTACDQNSWRGNYSCLRVDLIFTRDRAFYFTTVFIPGIILVTSSFITFWLEWNAVPARSMIGNYSCLQVEMTFTRDRAYYFTTVFIPGIILVTSSFITFWLEWNAVPARVMIGVTTMLNFFTTSNGFRSTLPVVSNLTAMNVWDGVCMCFIYASLLEFVCVNYVGRKRPLHNVVYRPGENPVTQRLPAVLSRIGVILASPLEIIEREFHAALSSEKAAGGSMPTTTTASPLVTPTATTGEQPHGSILGAAVQHLRARSVKYRRSHCSDTPEPQYVDPVYAAPRAQPQQRLPTATTAITTTAGALKENDLHNDLPSGPHMRHSRSMSTNTPPFILRDARIHEVNALPQKGDMDMAIATPKMADIDCAERQMPIKPPRRKTSRSTSPAVGYYEEIPAQRVATPEAAGGAGGESTGEKRREASGPNEIVACTSCGGGNSPCTHSANNGCATETCFVQVRKKEPPHPIRVAKTIDVIARITFPTAYSIFLIFFFVHYKGFS